MVFTDPGSTTMLLDVENAKSYMSPLGTMLCVGMNSGYYQRGSVHKKNGFDIKLDIAYVMFPPQSTTYDFIVPETPINVLFPFKFPEKYLKYKQAALLQYIPDSDGIFYENDISYFLFKFYTKGNNNNLDIGVDLLPHGIAM